MTESEHCHDAANEAMFDPEPTFDQIAANGRLEPILADAAQRTNVRTSSDSQKREKVNQGFAKGL